MSATTADSSDSSSPQLQKAEENVAAKTTKPNADAQSDFAASLERAVLKRKDLVVDFSSLRSCFEPLIETEQQGEDTEVSADINAAQRGRASDDIARGCRPSMV